MPLSIICPLCNNACQENDDLFACKKINKFGESEFYYYITPSGLIRSIQVEGFQIRYSQSSNTTSLNSMEDFFKINGDFKIINNSVHETFDHYKKMKLFS